MDLRISIIVVDALNIDYHQLVIRRDECKVRKGLCDKLQMPCSSRTCGVFRSRSSVVLVSVPTKPLLLLYFTYKPGRCSSTLQMILSLSLSCCISVECFSATPYFEQPRSGVFDFERRIMLVVEFGIVSANSLHFDITAA